MMPPQYILYQFDLPVQKTLRGGVALMFFFDFDERFVV